MKKFQCPQCETLGTFHPTVAIDSESSCNSCYYCGHTVPEKPEKSLNPLLRRFLAGMKQSGARKPLCFQYAWAIPNEKALKTLAEVAPIIEMGAGTGYWASLLRDRGVEVTAFDIDPPDGPATTNSYHSGARCHTTVLQGTPEILTQFSTHTLLLCWPPMSDMAVDCLRAFAGKRLVYIGEPEGGCCATDEFFSVLASEWIEEKRIEIPQWNYLHDEMVVLTKVPR